MWISTQPDTRYRFFQPPHFCGLCAVSMSDRMCFNRQFLSQKFQVALIASICQLASHPFLFFPQMKNCILFVSALQSQCLQAASASHTARNATKTLNITNLWCSFGCNHLKNGLFLRFTFSTHCIVQLTTS